MLPPTQCSPTTTDKRVAIPKPIKAQNCGVLGTNDPWSDGKETSKTRTARINSIR